MPNLSELKGMHCKRIIMWDAIVLRYAASSKACQQRGAGSALQEACCKVCAVPIEPQFLLLLQQHLQPNTSSTH